MTKEQLEKDYYADRPPEPYCDDVSSSDWANLAHYAEENLEKTFERIEELENEIKKWQGKFTYKCRIESYLEKHLTEAKEIIEGLLNIPDLIEYRTSEHTELIGKAEQFLKDIKRK